MNALPLLAQALLPMVGVWAVVAVVARSSRRMRPVGPAGWLVGSLCTGAAVALAGAALLPDVLPGAPLLASDFDQYCGAVAAVREGDWTAVPRQRGVAGALLPALLAHALGVIDGLWVSAQLARVALWCAVAAWGWAASGRPAAGVAAALLAVALHPLWNLGDTITFYPWTVAAGVACGAAATAAARWRCAGTVAGAAVVAGVTLVLDVRGLLTAGPALAVAVAVAATLPRRGGRARGLMAVGGALALSYAAAGSLSRPYAPGLEQQTLHYIEEAVRRQGGADAPSFSAELEAAQGREFLWGHRQARGLAGSMERVGRARARAFAHLEAASAAPDPGHGLAGHLGPLWTSGVLLGGLALVGAARRRDPVAVAAVLTLAPLLLALHTASQLVGAGRYFAMGAAAMAVLSGWGLAGGGGARRRGPLPAVAPAVVAGLALALLVSGALPSAWHPTADWRALDWGDTEPARSLHGAKADDPAIDGACRAGLRADYARGLPVGSRLLGWAAPAPDPTRDLPPEGETPVR